MLRSDPELGKGPGSDLRGASRLLAGTEDMGWDRLTPAAYVCARPCVGPKGTEAHAGELQHPE